MQSFAFISKEEHTIWFSQKNFLRSVLLTRQFGSVIFPRSVKFAVLWHMGAIILKKNAKKKTFYSKKYGAQDEHTMIMV